MIGYWIDQRRAGPGACDGRRRRDPRGRLARPRPASGRGRHARRQRGLAARAREERLHEGRAAATPPADRRRVGRPPALGEARGRLMAIDPMHTGERQEPLQAHAARHAALQAPRLPEHVVRPGGLDDRRRDRRGRRAVPGLHAHALDGARRPARPRLADPAPLRPPDRRCDRGRKRPPFGAAADGDRDGGRGWARSSSTRSWRIRASGRSSCCSRSRSRSSASAVRR